MPLYKRISPLPPFLIGIFSEGNVDIETRLQKLEELLLQAGIILSRTIPSSFSYFKLRDWNLPRYWCNNYVCDHWRLAEVCSEWESHSGWHTSCAARAINRSSDSFRVSKVSNPLDSIFMDHVLWFQRFLSLLFCCISINNQRDFVFWSVQWRSHCHFRNWCKWHGGTSHVKIHEYEKFD